MKLICILTALFMGITLDMSAQNYWEQPSKQVVAFKFKNMHSPAKVLNWRNGHQAAVSIKMHTPFEDLTDLGEGFWINEDVFQTHPIRANHSLIIGKAYKYQKATFVAQLNDFEYLLAALSDDMIGK